MNNFGLGLMHYIQEKKSLDYSPRLGRSSPTDDSDKQLQKPDSYYDNLYYAPRLGKKSFDYYSPRLGRSTYAGKH